MLKVGTKRTLNGYSQVNSPVKPVNPAAIPDGSITYDKLSEDVQSRIEASASGKEDTINKVTSLSASSTDDQYPSAKCVYDLLGDVETLINAL